MYTIWFKRKKENETHEDVKEKIINMLCDFEDTNHSTVDQCLEKRAVMFLIKLFSAYESR